MFIDLSKSGPKEKLRASSTIGYIYYGLRYTLPGPSSIFNVFTVGIVLVSKKTRFETYRRLRSKGAPLGIGSLFVADQSSLEHCARGVWQKPQYYSFIYISDVLSFSVSPFSVLRSPFDDARRCVLTGAFELVIDVSEGSALR